MLFSMALILLVGMGTGWICKLIKLPSLLGMIVTGIVLGPYVLNLIDPSILGISSELRRIALVIILTRAGLSLNIADLKKVGRPAILMCFLPACFEILGMILLAPKILGISILDAAIMGAVVGAVSPAVIVPTMIKIKEEGYGSKKSIPQLILAGASVDNIFVIVTFTAVIGLATGNKLSVINIINVPLALISGAAVGIGIGIIMTIFFIKIHIRDTSKVIIILCVGFLLITLENHISGHVPFSGLMAVMCLGIGIQRKKEITAARLALKFSKLWVFAEIILFVLVGATVNLKYAYKAGGMAVLLIFGVLIFRMAGVLICLIKTKFTLKEKLFCMIAYFPKATVQAAIGGIPLAMGLDCGNIVLTVAVLSILITAPLGAFVIDNTYKKLLVKN